MKITDVTVTMWEWNNKLAREPSALGPKAGELGTRGLQVGALSRVQTVHAQRLRGALRRV